MGSAGALMRLEPDQMTLQRRGVGFQETFHATGPGGAGDGADTGAFTQQLVLGDALLDQQQVATVATQRLGIAYGGVFQQLGKLQAGEAFALRQTQLQLQGCTAATTSTCSA